MDVIKLLSEARAKWVSDKDAAKLGIAVSCAIQLLEKANEVDELEQMSSPKKSKKKLKGK